VIIAAVSAHRIEFPSHVEKRGLDLDEAAKTNAIEFSRWDPVAKIDVVRTGPDFTRRVAYDGGSQSSLFIQFDGDFRALRAHYFDLVDGVPRYNGARYVALAHWLKRDRGPRVLVVGAAGGQETLAALAFGAAHVDAVEMVCAVFDAARGPFGQFTGHLYDNARVSPICDEGRSFLRHSTARYDVIQLHSNHTTSSIANGAGGAEPIYLQTVEAYKEYLTHLAPDGILQVNYFAYPRILSTAGAAWQELFPTEEFRRHVVITDGYGDGMLPTVLVKRSQWAPAELAAIGDFLRPEFAAEPRWSYRLIFAPGSESGVPQEFFRQPLSAELAERLPYKISPPTDDQPFFRDMRRHVVPLTPDAEGYVPRGVAMFLNASLRGSFPMETLHLYLLGGLSIVIAGLVVGVPLVGLQRRSLQPVTVLPSLLYFGCLGAGFIIIELVLLYKMMVVIGFPIYTLATVLFTLLVAAGGGSVLSERLLQGSRYSAVWIFPTIAALVAALVLVFPEVLALALRMGQTARMGLAAALIFPLGVALGVPFPAGIAILRARAPQLIPWAWGVNGFATVVGSLLACLCSMRFGFDRTLLLAAALYLLAMGALVRAAAPTTRPNSSTDFSPITAPSVPQGGT
jgi:spermidine synthase